MLSVISYNIMFNDDYFEQRHTALIQLLKINNVDEVCLQEVRADVLDWLIQQLYDTYTPAMDTLQPLGRSYGEIILVKKDITQISYKCIELDGRMGRALQHLELKKGVNIYNVVTFHFESMNSSKVRRGQLATMWKYVSGMSNVICCGDTNQTAKEVCTVDTNFLDAWEQTDGTIGAYTYYSGRFWGRDRKQRYDKVWFNKDLQLHGYGALGSEPIADNIWISDHDGIICLFHLKRT